ncbi:MAG: UbiA family prenyltransferase [Thermodesulfobacteriota bacterium]
MVISAKIRRLIEKGETYSIDFWAYGLNLLGIIFLRAFLEGVLESRHLIGHSISTPISFPAFFRHFPLFFLLSHLVILLILHLFTREKIDRIAKIVLLFFPIILIPPIADYLLTWGQGERLYYVTTATEYSELILNFFIPFHTTPGATSGLRIEITLLLTLLAIYVFMKTRSLIKVMGSALITFIILGFFGSIPFIVTAASNGLLMLLGKNRLTAHDIFKGQNCLIAFRDHRIEAILFILLVISFILLFSFWKKNMFASIIRDFRWSRFLHYLFISAFGLSLGFKMLGISFFDNLNPINYAALMIWLIALLFVFESAVLINDIHDYECDCINSPERPLIRREISKEENTTAAFLLLIIAGVSGSILGLHQLILIAIMWIAAYFYSASPFRLKKRFILNYLIIGGVSTLCFIYGFSLFGQAETPRFLPLNLVGMIFLYSFLCASIKDVKDHKGDFKCGVRTIMTVLNPSSGLKIIGVCICLSFMLCPVILNMILLIPLGVALGGYCLISAFKGKLRERTVFIFYLFFAVFLASLYLWNGQPIQKEKSMSDTISEKSDPQSPAHIIPKIKNID